MKIIQHQILISKNKNLLEHNCAHLLRYCLWHFSPYNAVDSCNRDFMTHKMTNKAQNIYCLALYSKSLLTLLQTSSSP